MAVTRINNNQITAAVDGNAYLGINAASKLQNYSITSNKIANSLVYGSDLTVSGNLTVNGTTTTVDTINTLIKDPILTLADGQTSGSPTVDIGLLGLRGSSNSSFLGWNEANTQFAAVLSNTTSSNTTVNITQYADFKAANIIATANLSVAGNILGAANFTGNVTAGNLISVALVEGVTVSASGNVIGGNVSTAGLITATGNITGGNIDTAGLITATGNVTGGNIATAGQVSATGNIYGGNVSTAGNVTASYFIGNISGNIDAAGSNTQVQFNDVGDILGASANFTFDKGTNVLTISNGNIVGGNVLTGGLISATGNATAGNVNTAIVSATGNVYTPRVLNGGTGLTIDAGFPGFVQFFNSNGSTVLIGDGGNISAIGNITGANILTAGLVSATGNATAGNINTAGLITATGNITGGNVLTGGLISATGNATAGNVLTGGIVSAVGNITTDDSILADNIVGANVTITSTGIIDLVPTGNIAVNSKNINNLADPVQNQDAATKFYVDSVAQGLDPKASVNAATVSTLDVYSGGTVSYNNGTAGVGATLTTTGTYTTIDGVNIATANTRILVKSEGNATWNGIYAYSNATVLTRTADFDQPSEVPSAFTFVEFGNTLADTGWVCTTNSPVTFGTSNITFVQFSGAGSYTANTSAGISLTGTVFSALVDNTTTAFDGGGNIIVKASANLTTPNIGNATGQSLQLTTAGGNGLLLATTVSATGNAIAGNVSTVGLITATGNITGGNVLTGGLVSATGNLDAGNLRTTGLVSASGNITLGGNLSATSAANVTFGDNTVLYSGYTTIIPLGIFHDTGANPDTIQVSTNSRANGIAMWTNGVANSYINSTGGIEFVTGSTLNANANPTGGVSRVQITTDGLTANGIVSASGNVTGANINTAGLITATGNVIGGNITTAGQVSATGNIYGGNVSTAGNVTASYFIGNISGNIDAAGSNTEIQFNGAGDILTANANFTYDYVTNLMTVNGGNISAGNVSASGNVIATAGGYFGNIVISGDNITDTNGRVNFNTAVGDVDFAVNGTAANIFYVDAGTNSASFGSSTQVTNALVAFNTTTSILLPAGTTGQRPSNASSTTGMIRFNSTTNSLEVFDNSAWTTVGIPSFTVIADEQFAGDGTNVAFTLSSSQTTNSCIVSINGIVQIPGTAYSVAGTDPTCVLTFTEAPAVGDTIDVREITTTTTVTAVANNSGNAEISGNATVAQMDLTGNLVPAGSNATQTLGSSSSYWQNIYTSNVTVSTLNVNNIVNSGANGAGNIGSSTTYFNTVFAKATSAVYADLAEKYVADQEYAPGTVVSFGGDKEVTQSTVDADRAVAGVISTNPSYIMNATLEAEHVAVVAFTGRVPTSVTGTVVKGDLMVSNGDGTARAEQDPRAGAIIGKALENFSGTTGTIEVVIGRF